MQKLRFLSLAVSMAMASLIDTKKVTKDFLESEIDKVEYNRLGGTLTHCTIYTHDGFTFTGESACVDPEQFNEEIGRQIAYKMAFDKMYMPYGFWLHKTLRHQNQAEENTECTPVLDLSDLASAEIDHDTLVGHMAEKTGDLIEWLDKSGYTDKRWLNIAKTDLQKGFMSLMRSVVKPETF